MQSTKGPSSSIGQEEKVAPKRCRHIVGPMAMRPFLPKAKANRLPKAIGYGIQNGAGLGLPSREEKAKERASQEWGITKAATITDPSNM